MSYQQLETVLSGLLAKRGVHHFSATEILFEGASNSDPDSGAYGLNTLPPAEMLPVIADATANVERFRVEYGGPLRVVSVYRSPDYNRALSGTAAKSFHMRGMAVDVAPAHGGVAALHSLAERWWSAGKITGGLGIYPWGIHLDIGPRRRW